MVLMAMVNQKKKTSGQEVRRSRIIGFHSKGLTQSEIAHKLNVDS